MVAAPSEKNPGGIIWLAKSGPRGEYSLKGLQECHPRRGEGAWLNRPPSNNFFFANLTHLHKEPQPSTEPSKKIHLFFCRWPLGVTDFRGELAIVCESFPCKIIGHLPTCPWEAIPIIRMRFPDGVRKI